MGFGQFLQSLVLRVEGVITWLIGWLKAGGFPRVLALIIVIIAIWWACSKARQYLLQT